MRPTFALQESEQDGLVRLVLRGEVDLLAVPVLREAVTRQLDSGTVRAWEIDLSGATFLDSSGVGALLECRRTVRAAGWPYRVVNATGPVAYVLELTGVAQLLTDEAPPPAGTG